MNNSVLHQFALFITILASACAEEKILFNVIGDTLNKDHNKWDVEKIFGQETESKISGDNGVKNFEDQVKLNNIGFIDFLLKKKREIHNPSRKLKNSPIGLDAITTHQNDLQNKTQNAEFLLEAERQNATIKIFQIEKEKLIAGLNKNMNKQFSGTGINIPDNPPCKPESGKGKCISKLVLPQQAIPTKESVKPGKQVICSGNQVFNPATGGCQNRSG